MPDYRAKFDSELRDIHTSFLDLRRGNRDRAYPIHSRALHGRPVSLLLQFGDDLAGIEARGFRTEWAEGHFARGDVELSELEGVASHPEVIRLEYGGGFRPLLDTSAVEIKARGQDTSLAVWKYDTTAAAFQGFRGTGVLIGLVDTGIDIHHPVFLKAGSTNTTRIRRIWDQGVAPHDGIASPDVSLLQGNVTYGVEYTEQMINDVLQGKPGAKFKHKDCFGHGTHAASIAAGNGSAVQAKKDHQFIGVAPEADLIIVAFMYLQSEPAIDEDKRFEDALTYIERAAKQKLGDPPFVINVSLGWNLGPHDGLSARDQLLEARYQGATRKAFVAAAGNDTGQRQHGVIVIPAGGQVDVPFTLYDERQSDRDTSRCASKPNIQPEMKIEFWYPTLAAGATLTSSLRPPKGPAISGPALGSADIPGTYPPAKYPFLISHAAETAARPPGQPVTRNVLRIKFTPVKGKSYGTGAFTLRLNGPADTKIHAWADHFDTESHGLRIGLDIPGSRNEPDVMKRLVLPLPAGVTVADSETINYPASSAGAIAVGSYDDISGAIMPESSQGPLAAYTALGPYAAKPEVSAPGYQITAANGKGSLMASTLGKLAGRRYATWSGTSAAAPHVTGVAALMFEKKPALARADLIKHLEDEARPESPAEEFGHGKTDAKASRDAV